MIYNYNVYVHFYIQYEHNKYQTDNHILFGYFLQYFKYTADAYSQEVYSMYLSVVCFVCVYQCIHFKILNSHKCWPGNHIFRVLWILWSQIFKLNYFYVKFGLYSHFTRHAISISHYRYLVYSNKRPKGLNDHLSTKHPPSPTSHAQSWTMQPNSLEIIFHYTKTIH